MAHGSRIEWSTIYPVSRAPYPEAPGVYRIFLRDATAFAGTPLAALQDGALLYVGKAERGLRKRDVSQHLTSGRTGSSALRRSLGAVLRTKLGLRPRPRDDGRIANYRFDDVGEERLTEWMLRHLAVSWSICRSAEEARGVEPSLVRESCPVLNDTDNPNGQYLDLIRKLREECRRMAGGEEEAEGGVGLPR